MIRTPGATSVYRSISPPTAEERQGARPPAVSTATVVTGMRSFCQLVIVAARTISADRHERDRPFPASSITIVSFLGGKRTLGWGGSLPHTHPIFDYIAKPTIEPDYHLVCGAHLQIDLTAAQGLEALFGLADQHPTNTRTLTC